jgi:hypothetical protein
MNEPESKMTDSSELAELRTQHEALQKQVTRLLLGLVVLSLTLTAFMGLMARRAGTELKAIRPQATQVMEISKKEEPAIQAFWGKLVNYSKSHPDFVPYVEKYKNVFGLAGGTNAPAAATAQPPAVPRQ